MTGMPYDSEMDSTVFLCHEKCSLKERVYGEAKKS